MLLQNFLYFSDLPMFLPSAHSGPYSSLLPTQEYSFLVALYICLSGFKDFTKFLSPLLDNWTDKLQMLTFPELMLLVFRGVIMRDD